MTESVQLNIAALLPVMAGRHPDQPAVIDPQAGARLTFRQLNDECDRYAWGLSRLGVGLGPRTLLMVKPGGDFFSLTFALFKLGAVPLLIDPGMGISNLLGCIGEAAPEAFIAVPVAHAARVFFPRAFRSVKIAVTVGRRWFWGGPTLARIREASWPAQADTATFVAAIQQYSASQSFGSPVIWDRVGQYCVERNLTLPSLRRVLMAGAPVSPTVLERVHHILSDSAEAHTPYGATEALPVSSITAREVLRKTAELTRAGQGTCVGRPFPGITLRVIRITDEVIPAWDDRLVLPRGQIGELVVKGPVVTREYFR